MRQQGKGHHTPLCYSSWGAQCGSSPQGTRKQSPALCWQQIWPTQKERESSEIYPLWWTNLISQEAELWKKEKVDSTWPCCCRPLHNNIPWQSCWNTVTTLETSQTQNLFFNLWAFFRTVYTGIPFAWLQQEQRNDPINNPTSKKAQNYKWNTYNWKWPHAELSGKENIDQN